MLHQLDRSRSGGIHLTSDSGKSVTLALTPCSTSVLDTGSLLAEMFTDYRIYPCCPIPIP
jgi:hypothetical protein